MNQTVAAMYRRGTSEEQAVYVALVQGAANANDLFSAQRYVAGTIKSNRRELDHFLALKEDADRLRHEVDARAEEIRATRDEQAAERDRLAGAQGRGAGSTGRRPSRRRTASRTCWSRSRTRRPTSSRSSTPSRSSRGPSGEFLRQVQAGQRLAPRKKRTFKAPVAAPGQQRVRHPGAPHPR